MGALKPMDKAKNVLASVLSDADGDIHLAALTLSCMLVNLREGFSPGYLRCPTTTPSREQP